MAVITDIASANRDRPTVLVLPGWKGSSPGHRQTEWQRARPELRRQGAAARTAHGGGT